MKIFKCNDRVDHGKWSCWLFKTIFKLSWYYEYEKDEEKYWNKHEITLKHLVKNNEDKIKDLTEKHHLKIDERKYRRGDE